MQKNVTLCSFTPAVYVLYIKRHNLSFPQRLTLNQTRPIQLYVSLDYQNDF